MDKSWELAEGKAWKAEAHPDSSTVALMVVLKVLSAEIQFYVTQTW